MRVLFPLIVHLLLCLISFGQGSIKYTSANLNLRSAPTVSSQIVTIIPKGTSVTLSENCNCDWILVNYHGKVGYVSTKYLTGKNYRIENRTIKPDDNSHVRYYTNSFGERVQSPTYYFSHPSGATALCRDGTYSFSKNRRGTCSHHGGVARWLR